jgi:hypothetical protein
MKEEGKKEEEKTLKRNVFLQPQIKQMKKK